MVRSLNLLEKVRTVSRVRAVPIATVIASSFLLAGCGPVHGISQGEAKLDDAVLAIRYSPQLWDLRTPHEDTYLLLVDEQGQTELIVVEPMEAGDLLWGDEGLSYGTTNEEVLLTQKDVRAWPRENGIYDDKEEYSEHSRFSIDEGTAYVSIYNDGFAEDFYETHVVEGNSEGFQTWLAHGLYMALGQCENKIVGISPLFDVDNSKVSPMQRDRVDALVQLWPEPSGERRGVLSVMTHPDEGAYLSDDYSAPCIDGVLYVVSEYFTHEYLENLEDIPGVGELGLRVWDTKTGEHSFVPLKTPEGTPVTVKGEQFALNDGMLDAQNQYWWVTRQGELFQTNLGTGVTKRVKELPLSSPEGLDVQYLFEGDALFILDVDAEETKSPRLELLRYDFETDEIQHLIEIDEPDVIRNDEWMILWDMDIQPSWRKSL